MQSESFKKEYNILLKRFKDAERWIDHPDRKMKDITEKIWNEYQDIIKGLSLLMQEMKKRGIKFTDDEIIGGFKA